jgi:hypothetical protein
MRERVLLCFNAHSSGVTKRRGIPLWSASYTQWRFLDTCVIRRAFALALLTAAHVSNLVWLRSLVGLVACLAGIRVFRTTRLSRCFG